MKILCVDDCSLQLKLLKENLARNGFSADFAENGLIALAKIIENRRAAYRVVIVDLNFSIIDSLVFVGILRKADYGVDIIFHSFVRPDISRQLSGCDISYVPKGDYGQIVRRLVTIRDNTIDPKADKPMGADPISL